jgi:hypothetical protein
MAGTDDARAQLATVKTEGLFNMVKFFLQQLYIAGLRSKILEVGKASLRGKHL